MEMFTKQEINKLKIDAEETIAKMDMSKYNKNMFTLLGSALAIKNVDFSLINIEDSKTKHRKTSKKKNFDDYYFDAIKSLKDSMELYDLCEKMAYTVEDAKKLETFRQYLALILEKEAR